MAEDTSQIFTQDPNVGLMQLLGIQPPQETSAGPGVTYDPNSHALNLMELAGLHHDENAGTTVADQTHGHIGDLLLMKAHSLLASGGTGGPNVLDSVPRPGGLTGGPSSTPSGAISMTGSPPTDPLQALIAGAKPM